MKLPCLSMHQPWAALVVRRLKPIENRNWIIEREGVFLVHASKKQDFQLYRQVRSRAAELGIPYSEFPSFDSLPYGGIIGATEVTGIIDPKEQDDGWHFAGQYGHLLSQRTIELPFRPLKGLQRFWFVELQGDEEALIREAGLM